MNKKYILAGLASYLIWGFVPIVFKQFVGYDQFEVITFRMIFGAIAMFLLLAIKPKEHVESVKLLSEKPLSFKRKTYILTILGSILLAGNWLGYIYVINNISVNAGAFAYLILPIVTAFLGFFMLKERLNPLKWVGIVLSIVSCILIGNVNPEQLQYVSVVTLTYSFYMISQRINLHFNRRLLLGIQFFIGAIIMMSITPISLTGKPVEYWVYMVIFVIIFSIAPLLLNLYALKGIESSQLAFMIYINPGISFIIGITLYNEVVRMEEAVAFLILIVAVICFNWNLLKHLFTKKGRNPISTKLRT